MGSVLLFSFERSISLKLFFENWILNKTCSFCYVAIKIDFINVEKSVTKISNYILFVTRQLH